MVTKVAIVPLQLLWQEADEPLHSQNVVAVEVTLWEGKLVAFCTAWVIPLVLVGCLTANCSPILKALLNCTDAPAIAVKLISSTIITENMAINKAISTITTPC